MTFRSPGALFFTLTLMWWIDIIFISFAVPCGNSADNRESGENPERSGHCEQGVFPEYAIGSCTTDNTVRLIWEGSGKCRSVSQETCCEDILVIASGESVPNKIRALYQVFGPVFDATSTCFLRKGGFLFGGKPYEESEIQKAKIVFYQMISERRRHENGY